MVTLPPARKSPGWRKTLRATLCGALALVQLAGCESIKRTEEGIASASNEADRARGPANRLTPTRAGTTEAGAWLVGEPVFNDPQKTLPPIFQRNIDYAEELPTTLPAIVEMINSRTGIPVRLGEDAMSQAARTDESPRVDVIGLLGPEFSNGSALGLTVPSSPGRPQPGAAATPGSASSSGPGGTGRGAILRYSGHLKGFLDNVAARFGISWRWQDDAIQFFRYETKVFTINALAADEVEFDLSVSQETQPSQSRSGSNSNQSGSAGVGSGLSVGPNTQTGNTDRLTTRNRAEIRAKVKLWEEVKNNIERMISPEGQIAVSQGLATVTVTDVPMRIEQISRYVEQENNRLSRQVAIDFAIYAIEAQRDDGYGIDWQGVFKVLQDSYGFNISTAAGGAAAAANVITTGVVLDRPNNAAVTAANSIGGSRVFLRALSTQGNVSVVQQTTLTAPNGQPAIVRNAKERDYVSGFNVIGSTIGSLGGTASERTTVPTVSQAVDSFTLAAMPRILDGRRLMLQFSLSIEELVGFRNASSQLGEFQLRDVNRKNLMQRINLRSGQTLMIASVEQDARTDTMSGQGDRLLPILGGGRDTRRNKTVFVLVMTPQISGGF